MEMVDPKIVKTCHKCGNTFTTKACSTCSNKASEKWRNANRDKIAAKRLEQVDVHAARAKVRYAKERDHILALAKRSYAANPERWKINGAAYHARNPDYSRSYRESHVAQILETNAAWRAKNPEYRREHYLKNRDRLLANVKEWRKANPQAYKRNVQNRRARILFGGGVLSKGLEARLFKLQRGRCTCCGKSLGKKYHMDHIVPLAKGGLNKDSNMQLLRALCNHQKHAKDPIIFMQQRGFLL